MEKTCLGCGEGGAGTVLFSKSKILEKHPAGAVGQVSLWKTRWALGVGRGFFALCFEWEAPGRSRLTALCAEPATARGQVAFLKGWR